MQNGNSLNFIISNTINIIPEETWAALCGQELEGYGYHKALEESHLDNFRFWYLVGSRGGKIVAIIPFFTMTLSYTDIIQGPIKKVLRMIQKICGKIFVSRLLFVGTLAGEKFYYGIDKNEPFEETFNAAMEKLTFFKRIESILAVVFHNVSQEQEQLKQYCIKKSLVTMETLPSTQLHIKAKSLEEYIATLGPSTRKDVRRKLRKSETLATLTTEVREDISDIIDDVYALYSNNLTGSDISFESFTKEFFLGVSRYMRGVAKFFITRDKEKIVSFNLCFVKEDLCIDKYIGFDNAVAHKYHLYYTTFCHNIAWCIAHGISYYQPGQTDYEPKIRLGARLLPLFMYITTFNPYLDNLIRPIVGVISPVRYDPALKALRNRCPDDSGAR